jgi:hypothetical protein
VKNSDLLGELLQGGAVSLASWFARPLTPVQARAWLPRVRQAVYRRHRGPMATLQIRLAEIIVRFWGGHDVEPGYRNCLALCENDRERAMLELCYGQLLIACRLTGAWAHLDQGFELAARLLEAEDYFRVLNRHEVLRQLPLASTPSRGAPLEDLLDEARVIARLRGPRAASRHKDDRPLHRDTLD